MPNQKPSPEPCPIENFVSLISGPWTIIILLRLAQNGAMRFGALKRSVSGISSRMLTSRLRMLEENGLVIRDVHPTIPPEVHYSLSKRGDQMRELFQEIETLASNWDL